MRATVVWCLALAAGCASNDPIDRGRFDGSTGTDAGAPRDAGRRDAGGVDAGRPDAGRPDAGPPAPDAGCPGAPECTPGIVETGDVCGACGVQTRACDATCAWEPFACVEDPDRCDYWVHDGASWAGYTMRDSTDAPTEPILAAFPLDGTSDALVLTNTSFHRLARNCVPGTTECWIASGARSSIFPEVGTDAIRWADDIPQAFRGDAYQGVDLRSATFDYRYLYEVATGTFTHDVTGMVTGGGMGPARADIRAAYTILDGFGGWLSASCGDPTPMAVEDYIATIEASDVFVFTPGEGCGWIGQTPYASFAPFDEPGAPPIERVGAAFHRDRLHVLAR